MKNKKLESLLMISLCIISAFIAAVLISFSWYMLYTTLTVGTLVVSLLIGCLSFIGLPIYFLAKQKLVALVIILCPVAAALLVAICISAISGYWEIFNIEVF